MLAREAARCIALAAAAALASCITVMPASPSASWMTAQSKRAQRLLYVSDLKTFEVYVYDFPSLKLSDKLKGFNDPEGVCSDARGNVWIADTSNEDVVEYAHGGKSPIAILSDPTGYPASCATDPRSGDLAVTNYYGFSGAGSVLVYAKGRGTPRVYANPKQFYYSFAAYDGGGDLYVNGATAKNTYVLSVLPHGKSSLSLVAIRDGTLHVPGTVAWTGKRLILGDQRCKARATSCLYELAVTGRTARVTGKTPLRGSCDVVEAWVGGGEVVGGDDAAYCTPSRSTVDIWPYPAGGRPRAKVAGPGIPVGATLSVGP